MKQRDFSGTDCELAGLRRRLGSVLGVLLSGVDLVDGPGADVVVRHITCCHIVCSPCFSVVL